MKRNFPEATMDDLRRHLQELEEKLFDPDVRRSRSALEELLSAEFREIGASGTLWTFDEIADRLTEGEPQGVSRSLTDFMMTVLAERVCLVAYRATRRSPDGQEVRSLRSSIWRLDEDGRWRMLFHQGTLTQ